MLGFLDQVKQNSSPFPSVNNPTKIEHSTRSRAVNEQATSQSEAEDDVRAREATELRSPSGGHLEKNI